jgi:DNA-binding response OmpR family regulator
MSTRRILVADDKLVCWAFKKELSAHNYSVRTAESGSATKTCLREEAYPLAFIAMPLPGGDGLDIVAHCRDISPETRFVILSGDTSPASKQSAFDLGVWQYIEKPFKISQIIGLLEALFGEHSEKREQNRLLCRLQVRITIVAPIEDDADQDLCTLAGTTLDISDRGVQLETGYRLCVGQHVEVSTQCQDDPCAKPLSQNQKARVVWVTTEGESSRAGLCYL